jgi:hypothetical protein
MPSTSHANTDSARNTFFNQLLMQETINRKRCEVAGSANKLGRPVQKLVNATARRKLAASPGLFSFGVRAVLISEFGG